MDAQLVAVFALGLNLGVLLTVGMIGPRMPRCCRCRGGQER